MSNAKRIFALLTIATFFEGFDTRLAALVQPVIGREFDATREELGVVLGLSSVGMILAFFLIQLADRVGRRPVFLASLAGYAVLTLATAFAPNLVVYTVLQIFARMAMVTELGLAYLILSEEMPPEVRGRVNGLFGGCVALGACVPDALLHPLTQAGIGWRGLFLIGAIPLVLLPLYASMLEETSAFRARRAIGAATGSSLAQELARLRILLRRGERARLASVAGLWFIVNFWSATALYSFTLYVFEERDWTAADLVVLPLGTLPAGLFGYALAGVAMDRIGRRRAATLYLVAAGLATLVCYRATSGGTILAGYFALMALGGVWAIVTTWTAELFATEIRATATGFANNLIGRFGLVLGPIAVGQLGGALDSTGAAVSLLALGPLLGVPVVWSLPETNAMALTSPGAVSTPDTPERPNDLP